MQGNIPKALSNEEITKLFKEYQSGNFEAREKIINHNIRLVIYLVKKYFTSTSYDMEDLEGIGLSGLIKAVDNFDVNKDIKFITFASKVIYNEILMHLRRRHEDCVSLGEPIYANEKGDEITLGDTISDEKCNLEKNFEEEETLRLVREYVLNMPESKEKQVIIMYFGFNGRQYKQREISSVLNVTQSYISRILSRMIRKLGEELTELGIIDKAVEKPKNETITKMKDVCKKESNNIDSANSISLSETKIDEYSKSIMEQQKNNLYSKPLSFFDKIIKNLGIKEGVVVSLKLGFLGPFTLSNISSFLNISKDDIGNITIDALNTYKEYFASYVDSIIESGEMEIKFKQKDYMKMLRELCFGDFLEYMSIRDTVITCLRLGFVNHKIFTSDEISLFLNIDKEEIVKTTKKSLIIYKKMMNDIFNMVIDENKIKQNK